jgi:hypothetical protein
VKPHGGRVDGTTGKNGEWLVTPEEALNLHALQAANDLLYDPPKHFTEATENVYFCFLEMGYSQFPEWAIVHRQAGEVFVREDYRLSRPGGDTVMMATVLGPVFGLRRGEVRLWEAVAMHHDRGFHVIEDEAPES